jgi:hypothetical protein
VFHCGGGGGGGDKLLFGIFVVIGIVIGIGLIWVGTNEKLKDKL